VWVWVDSIVRKYPPFRGCSTSAHSPPVAQDLSSLNWRVILDPPAPGDWNMAVDHALATMASAGEGFLRLYAWGTPTISFGRNEPVLNRYSPDRLRDAAIGVVRRPTGGRAVVHDREVTYAVVVPERALGGPRATYAVVHRALARALVTLGVPAVLAARGRSRALRPDAGPCFGEPAPGEVVVNGRKLVGSAQARIGGILLQHGSLILSGDQRILDAIAVGPLRAGSGDQEPATSVSEILGREPAPQVVELALLDAFRTELGGKGWQQKALEPSVRREAERLRSRYASTEWTWRR